MRTRTATGTAAWPHVVILGAGFAGLEAAKALADQPLRVTVIDRSNHHLFQPLLYQVATAALSPANIARPIRAILRRARNVQVLLAEVTRIVPAERRVELVDGHVTYDALVVATGSRHSYFGHDAWEPHAPGLKSIADAVEIRRRILLAFEAAEREEDPELRQALMTFVVVGGGPTGVEMAGAIAEIARITFARDFRRIDPCQTRVVLAQAGPRVLENFSEDLSRKARTDLERLGVEVHTGVHVNDVGPEHVRLGDELVSTRCIIWAAGVMASPVLRSLGVEVDRHGRVDVDDMLAVKGLSSVYAVGDCACLVDPRTGRPLPQLASVAIQQGRCVARTLRQLARGRAPVTFRYRDRGIMATIGRSAAVAQRGRLELSGLPAWLAWLTVHLILLVGYTNKLMVLLQWGYVYLSRGRSARLILGPVHSILPEATEELLSHAGEVHAEHPRFAASAPAPSQRPAAQPPLPA